MRYETTMNCYSTTVGFTDNVTNIGIEGDKLLVVVMPRSKTELGCDRALLPIFTLTAGLGLPIFRTQHLLWPPYGIGQTIIFLPCDFYFSSFFFFYLFSSPNLSVVGEWISTVLYSHSWCGLSANLECMSEMCCTRLVQNKGRKKSPFWHHRTNLSGCIFAAKAYIDYGKKLVKHGYLLQMSP